MLRGGYGTAKKMELGRPEGGPGSKVTAGMPVRREGAGASSAAVEREFGGAAAPETRSGERQLRHAAPEAEEVALPLVGYDWAGSRTVSVGPQPCRILVELCDDSSCGSRNRLWPRPGHGAAPKRLDFALRVKRRASRRGTHLLRPSS